MEQLAEKEMRTLSALALLPSDRECTAVQSPRGRLWGGPVALGCSQAKQPQLRGTAHLSIPLGLCGAQEEHREEMPPKPAAPRKYPLALG